MCLLDNLLYRNIWLNLTVAGNVTKVFKTGTNKQISESTTKMRPKIT